MTCESLSIVYNHRAINIQTHVDEFVNRCEFQIDNSIMIITKNLIVFIDERDD